MSDMCSHDFLNEVIERREIVGCIRRIKNNKMGESDGLVGELIKYGGLGMVHLLEQLFLLFGMRRLCLKAMERRPYCEFI